MTTEPFWVPGPWPGRLGITPRPRGGDWLEDEVRAWHRAGVDTVLSLLTPDEVTDLGLAAERDLCLAAGIRFESFPIPDRGVPLRAGAFAGLVAGVAGDLGNGKTVLVHCRQGIGRAALVAIGALVASGVEPAAAIGCVGTARGCVVPETAEQRQWIADAARALAPPATAVE